MLSEKKLMALELMAMGDSTMQEIAKKCKCSFKTLYNWKEEEEFSNILQKRTVQFQNAIQAEGKARLMAKCQLALDNVFRLANTSESDKIRLDANTYLLDHILGKATTKVDVTARQDDSKQVIVDLDSLMIDIPEAEEVEAE